MGSDNVAVSQRRFHFSRPLKTNLSLADAGQKPSDKKAGEKGQTTNREEEEDREGWLAEEWRSFNGRGGFVRLFFLMRTVKY